MFSQVAVWRDGLLCSDLLEISKFQLLFLLLFGNPGSCVFILTLKMTSAQVIETSATNFSSFTTLYSSFTTLIRLFILAKFKF